MCRNSVMERTNTVFMLQFVEFERSYNFTPSVLISANHSTTAGGNLVPVHNGITTWIEVKHSALLLSNNNEIYAYVNFFSSGRNSIVTYLLFGVSIGVYHKVVTESNRDYLRFCLFPISSLNVVIQTGNHYSCVLSNISIII